MSEQSCNNGYYRKVWSSGKATEVSVMFEVLRVNLDSLVHENATFNVVIGLQTIEKLEFFLYFPTKVVRFYYRRQTAVLQIFSEYARLRVMPMTTTAKNFLLNLS